MDLNVITAGIPVNDGCPILRRVKAFLVPEGVAAVLEHTLRDRKGNPIDLTTDTAMISEGTSMVSESMEPGEDAISLRLREFIGLDAAPVGAPWAVEGVIVDASAGLVRAKLPNAVVGQSGLYEMSWGVTREMELVYVENALLSVERTLFAANTPHRAHTKGSPTIQEIRMQMWDSDPEESHRLDDVEFDDAQILTAISKPVDWWNRTNPPIGVSFDTRTFPWHDAWIDAAIGYLFEFAVIYYKRNRLAVTSGGKMLDEYDPGRIKGYEEEAQRRIAEWKDWVLRKKIEINAAACVGGIGSGYASRWGW